MIKKIKQTLYFLFLLLVSPSALACDNATVWTGESMQESYYLHEHFAAGCPANVYTVNWFGNMQSFCNTAGSLNDFNNNLGDGVDSVITDCIINPPPIDCSTTLNDKIDHFFLQATGGGTWNPVPPNIESGQCEYTYSPQAGNGCNILADSSLWCTYTYKGTGADSSGGTPVDPDDTSYNSGSSGTEPVQDVTTTTQTPIVQPDTPTPGDTTTTEETTEETIEQPSETVSLDVKNDEVVITTDSGSTVTKNTQTTTETRADGTTTTTTTTSYSDSGSQGTTQRYDISSGTTSTTNSSNEPYEGSTTTTTITNADGSGTETTEGTGDCKDDPEKCGDEESGKFEPDEIGEYKEPGERVAAAWARINASPLLSAINNTSISVPSGGTCPPLSFVWLDSSTLSTTLHCDLYSSVSGVLSLVMIAVWSWIGIRIVMSA